MSAAHPARAAALPRGRRDRLGLGQVRRGPRALQGPAARGDPDRHGGRLQRRSPLRGLRRDRGIRSKPPSRRPGELWTKEITQKRNTRALLSAMLPKIFGFDERFGLVDDRLVLERLRNGFGEARFEDAKIPLYLTATDFFTGEQVVFSKGGIVDAIRASIAIPYIFRPGRSATERTWTGSSPTRCRSASRSRRGPTSSSRWVSRVPTRRASRASCGSPSSSRRSPRTTCFKANYAFHNLAHHHEILPIIPAVRAQDSPLRHGQDPVRHRGGRARGREADPVSPAARSPRGARDPPARPPSRRRRHRGQPGPPRPPPEGPRPRGRDGGPRTRGPRGPRRA